MTTDSLYTNDMVEIGDEGDEYPMSASQLKKFASCSLKYEYGYEKDIDSPDIMTAPIALGSAVHDTLEQYLAHNGMPDNEGADDIEQSLKFLYDEPDYPLPKWAKDRAIECLETAARFIDDRSGSVKGVEQEIRYPYDRVDGEPQRMYAICDAVVGDTIWDWKTGNVRAYNEQLQAGVYAAAYEAVYEEPAESVQFVYLSKGKIRKQYPGDELYGHVTGEIEGIRDARQSGDWPASPGKACTWCDYEGHCSYSTVGLGDVDWVQW